ncbi:DUF1489 family protein [Sphingosinicella sp. CPCC 101087]|uniref:DUF1489 family protein n=1 Tax=Sphingosinicella sp. CPCC 101087 TaxID=2497754 RepID=UPI00101C748C|nr:DUF1489 domain-containing protein [Sphingosinicella sp. CPCC 101087]
MARLHISKVAVGCGSVDALRLRQQSRLQGDHVPITTRFRPKRAEELIGGSIYWIVKHRLAVRQTILGFAESEGDRRTIIRLDPTLVPVRGQPKRAHQGWRYLGPEDVPPDLGGDGDGVEALPPQLAERLAVLALI